MRVCVCVCVCVVSPSTAGRVRDGNAYLLRAKQTGSLVRRYVMLFLLLMSLVLLFLHWYG
jgi:hypothetical protein